MDHRWLVQLESYAKWSRAQMLISSVSSMERKVFSGCLPLQLLRTRTDAQRHLSRAVRVHWRKRSSNKCWLCSSCLLEIGNLINQHPTCRIPNDPDDGAYLCPNDMLLGRATPEVPQGPFNDTKNPWHRVAFVQKIVDSYWKRWNREVFPALVPRKKWHVDKRNVQVNDIVTVADSNAIRGKWAIGRILEVYPGSDGRVRNVKVKTATGEYNHPVTKIAVIHPAEGILLSVLCNPLCLQRNLSLYPSGVSSENFKDNKILRLCITNK